MSKFLRKKDCFTVVTPIPSFIPRQLALDILHAHSEVITLNPLVLSHEPISAPRDAASDEYYATWYEITERIQYVPGMGRIGSGKISFKGCFHDTPWGLQTHIYAPMNVNLRNTYRIAGNEPGEPPEVRELGLEELGAPLDGLYLREDIEIKCNITVMSFVRNQLKAAGKEMVRRIIKKAELLDSGVLQAMFQNGKLRTINPNDRSDPEAQNAIARGEAAPYASAVLMSPRSSRSTPTPPPRTSFIAQHPNPASAAALGHSRQFSQPLAPSTSRGSAHWLGPSHSHSFSRSHAHIQPPPPIEMPGDFTFPVATATASAPLVPPARSFGAQSPSFLSSQSSPSFSQGSVSENTFSWQKTPPLSLSSSFQSSPMHSPGLQAQQQQQQQQKGQMYLQPVVGGQYTTTDKLQSLAEAPQMGQIPGDTSRVTNMPPRISLQDIKTHSLGSPGFEAELAAVEPTVAPLVPSKN